MDSQYPPPAQYPPPPEQPPAEPPYGSAPASAPAPEWLAPARLPSAAPPPAGGPAAMFQLRPLTTGEVLDRTFTLYRSRFWLFAGIAAIAAAGQTVLAALQMAVRHTLTRHMNFAGLSGSTVIVGFCVLVIVFLAYSVMQAATVFAVSEVYLGRTTAIGESFRVTIGRWYAYIAIAIWQVFSGIWIPLLLMVPAIVFLALRMTALAIVGGGLMFLGFTGGVVGGLVLYLRNSLAIPAAVVERLKVRASMRRSKALAAGTKWRIFLVLLISGCLYMVIGMVQMPLAFLVGLATMRGGHAIGAEAGMLLIGFVGNSVVMPVAMIGLTLVYFDQRVRKEAFDIAMLLGDEQAVVLAAGEVPGAGGAATTAAPVDQVDAGQAANDVVALGGIPIEVFYK